MTALFILGQIAVGLLSAAAYPQDTESNTLAAVGFVLSLLLVALVMHWRGHRPVLSSELLQTSVAAALQ